MITFIYAFAAALFLILFVGLALVWRVRRREQAYREIAENLHRDPKGLPIDEEDLTASRAGRLADATAGDGSERKSDSEVRRAFEEAART